MPELWAAVHPYLPIVLGNIVAGLSLAYGRRDKTKDTARIAGQQLTDNLYKENERLTKALAVSVAETAAAEKSCEEAAKEARRQVTEAEDKAHRQVAEAEEKRREIQVIHDEKMAEWIKYGTTRAEQLEQAKFAYQQRQAYAVAHPEEDARL